VAELQEIALNDATYRVVKKRGHVRAVQAGTRTVGSGVAGVGNRGRAARAPLRGGGKPAGLPYRRV